MGMVPVMVANHQTGGYFVVHLPVQPLPEHVVQPQHVFHPQPSDSPFSSSSTSSSTCYSSVSSLSLWVLWLPLLRTLLVWQIDLRILQSDIIEKKEQKKKKKKKKKKKS